MICVAESAMLIWVVGAVIQKEKEVIWLRGGRICCELH